MLIVLVALLLLVIVVLLKRRLPRSQSDFIANASHELRTPVTVIRGFAETLQTEPHMSEATRQEVVDKIVRNCRRLDKLVHNLLTLSDLNHIPDSSFEPIDLLLVIENSLLFTRAAHPEARVQWHSADAPIWVPGNADLLELAITNLLDNAIKYSPAPPQVDLELQLFPKRVCIAIRDRGIGIPTKELPHVFKRFYAVDKARSRKLGGVGLGLSIAQAIVKKHGGRITATSQLGEGSCFTIEIPRA